MNIINTIKNTWLCIKYPFLYPRNRFTGEHYSNRFIDRKIDALRKKYLLFFNITVISNDKFNETITKINKQEISNYKIELKDSFTFNDYDIKLNYTDKIINITSKNNNEICNRIDLNINDYTDSPSIRNVYFYILKIGGVTRYAINIVIPNEYYKNNYYYKHIVFYLNTYTSTYISMLNKVNTFLGYFHILPNYTELDALDEGWRLNFGEAICREIKHSLLYTDIRNLTDKHTKYEYLKAYLQGIRRLYNYRIEQIKEKFGSLRWYDCNSTEDVHNIINKYDSISAKTCIVCGKPAKYITTGWICPYCEEHVPDKDKALLIKDE